MAVDLLGGVFSILSLVFKSHFDATAAVAYALVAVSFLISYHLAYVAFSCLLTPVCDYY